MNPIEERRIGTIRIADEYITANYDEAAAVLRHILVTRAEHDYARAEFVYCGYSKLFKKLGKGFIIPEYDLYIDHTGITAEQVVHQDKKSEVKVNFDENSKAWNPKNLGGY